MAGGAPTGAEREGEQDVGQGHQETGADNATDYSDTFSEFHFEWQEGWNVPGGYFDPSAEE
jgi:hypothetical protein